METVSPALVTDLHAGALPELAGDGRLSFEVLGRQPMSWSAKAEAAHSYQGAVIVTHLMAPGGPPGAIKWVTITAPWYEASIRGTARCRAKPSTRACGPCGTAA